MGKKALSVGINDYPYDGADLNGCVNDAKAWADLLINHYDFPSTDVKLLVDNLSTKSKIIEALKFIATGTKMGDVLVFSISSHGTGYTDFSGDDPNYTEAICPYDCADNLITMDELREVFENLVHGVNFTMILDTGFAGTVTRAVVSEFIPGLKTPDERRVRFLSSDMDLGGRDDVIVNDWETMTKYKGKHSVTKAIVLRASSRFEYAYEALIQGVFHGAMTYFVLKVIREANYEITYAQLHSLLQYRLVDAGYPQHPQLNARSVDKKRQVFT